MGQASWNREKRHVCAIASVDQVVRILTPYEIRSRSVVMNLRYSIMVCLFMGFYQSRYDAPISINGG